MDAERTDEAASGMKILIVNMTRLGDQLQTSATNVALKARYPDAEITVLGDRKHMAVCREIPGIDHVYEVDLDRIGVGLLSGGAGLVEAYRYVEQVVHDLRRRGFTLACNFSSSSMSSAFMRLLRIPDTRGWTMDSQGNRLILNPWSRLFVASVLNRRYTAYNLVDVYCRIAGVRPLEPRLWYAPTDAGRAKANEILSDAGVREGDRLIAFQPGASKSIRRWPASSFGALGRMLVERLGVRIVLVGGREDARLCEEIASGIGRETIVTAGKTDLPTLAGLLERVSLLVTGDTGPMHVAAAVGTPVVAFYFGPAYVWETGPYGPDHLAFQTRIGCSPCHHALDCLAPVCREQLEPEMVYWAVHDRLAGDFDGLARRARAWSEVDLYRITFDEAGMFEPVPLVPRPDVEDAFRLVFREMWRLVLDERDGGEAAAIERLSRRWRERIAGAARIDFSRQRRALHGLLSLAERGRTAAEALEHAVGEGGASIGRLEKLSGEIEAIDAEIAQRGHAEAAVATLARTFSFGKENLSDTRALDVLSRETVELYGALATWCAVSLRLLDVIEVVGVSASGSGPSKGSPSRSERLEDGELVVSQGGRDVAS